MTTITLMKKTILIGMTSLGAGHKQSAVSVSNAIRNKYPGRYRIEIIDVFTEGKTILDPLFKKGYRYFSNHFTFLYAAFFHITNLPGVVSFLQKHFNRRVVRMISLIIKRLKPDLIVTTYPVFPQVFYDACKLAEWDAKIVALVLDLETGHNSWLTFKDVDSFLIPSEACVKKARRMGIPREKIIKVDLPLSPKFSSPLAKDRIEALRTKFRLKGNRITVLIAGGGEGIKQGYSIAKEILESGMGINLIVVCGRNRGMKKRMSRLVSRYRHSHAHVLVLGFTKNMYELMNVSDIIISKGGYLTVNEVLVLLKPLIVASYVPGQERGNVEFVVKNRLGYYLPNPKNVVSKIKGLINHPEELAILKTNIKKMGLRNGIVEIGDIIAEKAQISISRPS